ncbi:MAG TPA: hypothetical protein ENN72_07600 [Firmicutes bacterium]|jgi:hypothetical protein|nr:hypothetical protein [Bacillota bacterium]
MAVCFDFSFRRDDSGLVINVGGTVLHISKPRLCSLRIEYPEQGQEMSMEITESCRNSDYLATYVVAEVFKHVLEMNKSLQKERMLEIYAFFNDPRCRELEEAVLDLLC